MGNEALRLYTEIMNRESSHESEHQDAINKCTQKNEVFPQFKKANENLKLMKSQLDGHLADKKIRKELFESMTRKKMEIEKKIAQAKNEVGLPSETDPSEFGTKLKEKQLEEYTKKDDEVKVVCEEAKKAEEACEKAKEDENQQHTQKEQCDQAREKRGECESLKAQLQELTEE